MGKLYFYDGSLPLSVELLSDLKMKYSHGAMRSLGISREAINIILLCLIGSLNSILGSTHWWSWMYPPQIRKDPWIYIGWLRLITWLSQLFPYSQYFNRNEAALYLEAQFAGHLSFFSGRQVPGTLWASGSRRGQWLHHMLFQKALLAVPQAALTHTSSAKANPTVMAEAARKQGRVLCRTWSAVEDTGYYKQTTQCVA